mgnify:CR=1 FL=1
MNHRSGHFNCRRVNLGESATNAKQVYENVKCDICHEPAFIVIETYRNIDTAEFKKGVKQREMNKRMYLCQKHVKEMSEILKFFAEVQI